MIAIGKGITIQTGTKSSGSAQTFKNILQSYQLIAKNMTPMASMNLSLGNNNQTGIVDSQVHDYCRKIISNIMLRVHNS